MDLEKIRAEIRAVLVGYEERITKAHCEQCAADLIRERDEKTRRVWLSYMPSAA